MLRPASALEPGWELAHGLDVLIKARYTLLLDDLFDLTHVIWVHASHFGGKIHPVTSAHA